MEWWDEVEAFSFGHAQRLFAGGVEVGAEFHKFSAEGAHGCVLLDRVAVGRVDHRTKAGGGRSAGLGLAVIAAGGGDDALRIRMRARQPVDEGDAAPDLEGAGGGMVFVLDPDGGAGALAQCRPVMLGRGGHVAVYEGGSLFKFPECEHQVWAAASMARRRVRRP